MTLTILGLGPGDSGDITRRAWTALATAETVYLRTARHPCVPELPNNEHYQSFDAIYDQSEAFEQVYDTIVVTLLDAAAQGDVVYAVPGDPYVGESTTARLVAGAAERGIAVTVLPGISFVEPTLALVGEDGMDNLQILDGIDVAALHHPNINPDSPALIGQVYNQRVASDVKLTLMNQYPDEFTVKLVHGAGTADAMAEELPLYAIDRSDHIDHLTSLYVRAMGGLSSFEAFQEIIAHLRAPEGCPWDRKQTHESLRPYLIEEAYEVLEAIDNGDATALYEEMGDLLLQIVLHTQIAIDDGEFNMTDVLRHVNQKMIHRHPHVWGTTEVDGSEQVVTNWEAIKAKEKAQNGTARESRLDGVPKGAPALLQAYKYQDKAARIGFDWTDVADVIAKIEEEIAEVKDAKTADERFEEIGDLLFVLVNWARHLGINDPESALREANAKFYRRFRFIEEQVTANEKPIEDYTLDQLDALWNAAKAEGL